MTASPLPAIGLIGLLDTFALDSHEAVRQRVVDTAAENYEAEIVAIVTADAVVQATGLGGSDELTAQLLAVTADASGAATSTTADLGFLGQLHLVTLPIDGDERSRFVIARSLGPFDPGELRGCRAMVRIMRLAMRTIDAFRRQVEISDRLTIQVEHNLLLANQVQQRHTDFMARVLAIQDLLTSSSGSALEAIVEQGGALLDGAVVGLQLLRPDGMLELHHITPNAPAALRSSAALVAPGEGIGQLAVSRNELIKVASYDELSRPVAGLDSVAGCSVMSAPVRRRHEVVGALTVNSLTPNRAFTRDDLETLLLLAGYTSVALTDALTLNQRQRALEQAEWQATHDPLTGLANRRLVLDTITDRLNNDQLLHVLYIDVDRFKSVNDLYGHHVGDQLICEVARRINLSTRLDDLVGRLAGDEFIVVCGVDVDYQRASAIAERIRRKLNGSVNIDGRAVPLSVSIGIATSDGVSSADDVINAADVAMYQAKSGGRNQVGRYDEELQTRLRRQAVLAERLETVAATGDAFHLAYQPIVEIETEKVVGYEALLRWNDPILGRVTPDEFIPIAEEVGLIARIDDWVMGTALREAAAAGVTGSLSVNVSPAWLAGDGAADRVAQLARLHGFPLKQLSIEVTERVALAKNVTAMLSRLRKLGVRIMLDDFGTGYSSLAYVQTLEIDGIKIDRGFLTGVESDRHAAAILEAVVTLTDRLQAVAIAEGVETLAHARLLTELGCRLAQGYYFGRPTPAPEGLAAHLRPRTVDAELAVRPEPTAQPEAMAQPEPTAQPEAEPETAASDSPS